MEEVELYQRAEGEDDTKQVILKERRYNTCIMGCQQSPILYVLHRKGSGELLNNIGNSPVLCTCSSADTAPCLCVLISQASQISFHSPPVYYGGGVRVCEMGEETFEVAKLKDKLTNVFAPGAGVTSDEVPELSQDVTSHFDQVLVAGGSLECLQEITRRERSDRNNMGENRTRTEP